MLGRKTLMAAVWVGTVACSAGGGDVKLGARCSPDQGTCTPGGPAGGAANLGTGGALGFGGASDRALSVHVEDAHQLTIQILTLACAGDCADIRAVPVGGNAPYTFAWEDRSTSDTRHVCLDADETLTVSATDSGVHTPEFQRDAQTATATVTATVIGCTPPDAPDSGAPPETGTFCVSNPGMEGTTTGITELVGWTMKDWTLCSFSPDVGPRSDVSPSLSPTEGKTYFSGGTANPDPTFGGSELHESAGTPFCAPLAPRVPVPFRVDLAAGISSLASASLPVFLEIWGGRASCGQDELLWVSPPISSLDSFQTFCGTLFPAQADAFLRLVPRASEGGTGTPFVLVDNFRPAASCD